MTVHSTFEYADLFMHGKRHGYFCNLPTHQPLKLPSAKEDAALCKNWEEASEADEHEIEGVASSMLRAREVFREALPQNCRKVARVAFGADIRWEIARFFIISWP